MMSWVGNRVIAATLGVAGAVALGAPMAHAGPVGDAADCSAQVSLSQPFLPWMDIASYAPSPDGGFENGAAGWSLSGSAATAAGNESYSVGGGGDARSLRIPSGSSATSAPTCVGLQWPTIRFFARAGGTGLLSSLRVDVVVDDALSGTAKAIPIGFVAPTGSWRPSAPMIMVVNTLGALAVDGMLPVAFRFTPVGSGTWQVDDLYVDPWRGP
jgi:hypothetical protein